MTQNSVPCPRCGIGRINGNPSNLCRDCKSVDPEWPYPRGQRDFLPMLGVDLKSPPSTVQLVHVVHSA